jgi:GNAT superfamily N-acetyltransferase
MIRPALRADIPRIFEIRDSVTENRLTDPESVTEEDAAWYVDNDALWVWQDDDGAISGFAAGDPRDGWVWALFVAPGHEGRGIGRALLEHTCASLREAGHPMAKLMTGAGTRAERHYRAAGWTETRREETGEIVFQKPL